MSSLLRKAVVRLAYQRPDLRPDLLLVLRGAARKSNPWGSVSYDCPADMLYDAKGKPLKIGDKVVFLKKKLRVEGVLVNEGRGLVTYYQPGGKSCTGPRVHIQSEQGMIPWNAQTIPFIFKAEGEDFGLLPTDDKTGEWSKVGPFRLHVPNKYLGAPAEKFAALLQEVAAAYARVGHPLWSLTASIKTRNIGSLGLYSRGVVQLNGAYLKDDGRKVVLESLTKPPLEILVHEVAHAWHDLKVPGGYKNPEIKTKAKEVRQTELRGWLGDHWLWGAKYKEWFAELLTHAVLYPERIAPEARGWVLGLLP